MSGEFDGLTAVVTGGAAGIGRAVADELATRGARVIVLDLAIDGLSEPLTGIATDVADSASVARALDEVERRFGALDIVVNNAGIGAFGSVDEVDDAEWARVLSINVTGMARVTSAALPLLRRSAHAAVVNLSSIAATTGIQQRALYSASKGAVHALTLALAADHVHEGIRVNAVAPGTADTPWVARMVAKVADPVAERAAMSARQPIGRLVSAAEVAEAVLYLASPRSASTTGSVLAVDGGFGGLRVRAVQG